MGVESYVVRGVKYWMIDETITMPDGREKRLRKRRIPSEKHAELLVAKARADAFEGKFFDRMKPCTLTVKDVWELYEPISKRDNDTHNTDKGRATHLLRHIGDRRVVNLGQADVDFYREERSKETTKRNQAPAPATLDREVELLKRAINYAAKCKKVPSNPISDVSLLRRPNVRRRIITEEQFQSLLAKLEVTKKDTPYAARVKLVFRAIVTVAFDTGERKMEILNLKRSQLNLREGYVELAAQDTKTEEARRVYLTQRAVDAINAMPRDIRSDHVFINPETGEAYRDIRKLWVKYRAEAGISAETWFHDYRRAYITNSRRMGIDERTIMRQSGHKTRAAFDRYNIVDDSDQREAVKRYEAALRQESVKVGVPSGK